MGRTPNSIPINRKVESMDKEKVVRAKTDQLVMNMPAELREKDDGDTGIMIESYGRAVGILQARMSKLTGHAYNCQISIDPIYKPCTCGRG